MAPDDGSPQLELERVDRPRSSRLPAILISTAVILVAVLVVKPWPVPTEGPADTGNHPVRTPAPTGPNSAGGVTGESGYFQQCFPIDAWRVTAIQEHGSFAVRTVWPAAPSFVDSDEDVVRIYGPGVQAIGFCAPGVELATRAAETARVSLYRRGANGDLVLVDGARIIDHALAAQGEVYLAPPTPIAADGNWPAGDYYFAISQDNNGSESRTYLGVEVTGPVPAAPSASPARTGGPNG